MITTFNIPMNVDRISTEGLNKQGFCGNCGTDVEFGAFITTLFSKDNPHYNNPSNRILLVNGCISCLSKDNNLKQIKIS